VGVKRGDQGGLRTWGGTGIEREEWKV